MATSSTTSGRSRIARRLIPEPPRSRSTPEPIPPASAPASPIAPRRIASNFAALSVAEIACRATSVAVTLYLAQCLGTAGFGRIEFAFNVVFWLVLLVREGLDVLAAREIARHPRLVRPMVNHVLALRGLLALALFTALLTTSGLTLSRGEDRLVLGLYGLLLATTALGLDFVFRGLERMSLVAVSLILRTTIYAVGVALIVSGPERLVWVPICLVAGEAGGIALVWTCYARHFGLPRPSLSGSRALSVMIRRGRPVYLIQVSQAVIGSIDLLVVGLMSRWADIGQYSAAHRMVTAVLTFGLIFQQVVFPALARSWRDTPEDGRRALDLMVRVLTCGLLPLVVGTIALARPLASLLLEPEYAKAGPLLMLGIWRAPLLTLAFLYQTTLIALNRESQGVRILLAGAIFSGPLVAAACWGFGLQGAAVASVAIALSLMVAGYRRLARVGRQPAWHHHLARPLLASSAMVPVCLLVEQVHVLLAVLAGALTYLVVLAALGGLKLADLRTLLGRASSPDRRVLDRDRAVTSH